MTDLIRWEQSPLGTYLGYAGTHKPWLFQIYPQRDFPWALSMQAAGHEGRIEARADNPEDLKPRAEELLREFASSLGAVFPDADRPKLLVTAAERVVLNASGTKSRHTRARDGGCRDDCIPCGLTALADALDLIRGAG